MATSNLILNATDSFGKSINKTITNLNPEVNSETAKTFAQMLNGFTTNTYVSTNRVDKANVDTEATGSTPDTRQTPTLTFNKTGLSINDDLNGMFTSIVATYSGDGTLYIKSAPVKVCGGLYSSAGNVFRFTAEGGAETGTVTIAATETANYKAVEATFPITA